MMLFSSTAPLLGGVRRAVKQSLFSLGYYHQRLSRMAFPGAAILCFHGIRRSTDTSIPFRDLHVSEETFENHCRLIATACHPISLDDVRAARAGTRSLPARPVIVTFDDGYSSVLHAALPILERYGIPAAVFVCATPVLQSENFWFDTLCCRDGEDAVARAGNLAYAQWQSLTESVRTASNPDASHRPLTRSELARLAASSLIEIGGHTLSHPALARATAQEQLGEIAGCRIALEEMLGRPVNAFAYPFGRLREHYRPETVKAVRDAGFDMAFTTNASFVDDRCDAFEIPRFVMLDSVTDIELAHRLVHSWPAAAQLV